MFAFLFVIFYVPVTYQSITRDTLYNITENIFINETDDNAENVSTVSPIVTRTSTITFQPGRHLNHPQISSQIYSRRKMDECWKEAVCEPLEEPFCFGVPLPYTHTSLALSKLPSQRAARELMESLTSLKNLPHCWAVIQPFICAVLFPKCNSSSVQLPSIEMCAITRGACRLYEKVRGWPEALQCRQEFPPKCKTASRDIVFNTTGQCPEPLLNTSIEAVWVDGFRGCGLQCSNPLFTGQENEDLKASISLLGGISLGFSALSVLTFLIDWRCASKYPALIIFYMNGCFLVTSIGFIVQFYDGVRDRITCYPDGTLRNSEPSSGGNLSCIVVFVCIYYFMIAASMWFIVLGYAWYQRFRSLACGQNQDKLARKASYFHLMCWSIPLVFTIGVIASSAIEADPSFGICFLSSSVAVQVGALLIPVVTGFLIGTAFLVAGLKSLIRLKLDCSNIISANANKKIMETIVRLCLFVVLLFSLLVIAVYCRVYAFLNQDLWKRSLSDYILCISRLTSDDGVCSFSTRPDVRMYVLSLVSVFGCAVLVSSWCWTSNTVKAWQRFLRRVVGVADDSPARLTKHKVIAEAFAKRNDLHNIGRLSITLRSLHSDPLGLNFEMNSATSCDVSSTWAAAIPQLMNRRGGVCPTTAFDLRRNSLDSEYSLKRRFSMESSATRRRYSLDSQLSFHVSDVERFSAMQTAAKFDDRRRRGRRSWFSRRPKRRWSKRLQGIDRRNSTSDESNLGSMVLPGVNFSVTDSLFTTMMKRLNLSSGPPTPAPDSADEDFLMQSTSAFFRKFDGFKRKEGLPLSLEPFTKKEIEKASVAVQTSLDSLHEPLTRDQSCQVSTPLLQRHLSSEYITSATTTLTSSSPCGSVSSSSERLTRKIDRPITTDNTVFSNESIAFEKNRKDYSAPESNSNHQTIRVSEEILNSQRQGRRSLSPLLLDRSVRQGVSGPHKKRSRSENESTHSVIDFEKD